MKKLTILTFLITNVMTNVFASQVFVVPATSAPLNGTTILFPDVVFKNYLTNNSSINTNGDGVISVQEAYNFVGKINISGLGVTNILGIEYFSNLKVLDISNTNIDSIDLRLAGVRGLDSLICKNNLYDVLYVGSAYYINIKGNVNGVAIHAFDTTAIVLADSVWTFYVNLLGDTITSYVSGYGMGPGGEYWYNYNGTDPNTGAGFDLLPTYTKINVANPFTCNNIIGLTNICVPYDSVVWNTGERTPILFNQCSGQHILTIYSKELDIRANFDIVYRILDFSIVDTTITYNNPNTYSVTPIDTISYDFFRCPDDPSVAPEIVGIWYTDYANDSTFASVIWSYSTNSLVDTFTTVVKVDSTGLHLLVDNMYCYNGGNLRSSESGLITTTDYVYLEKGHATGIVWVNGTVLTSIEMHSSNQEITIAPNPFSTSTKITIPLGLTNGKVKITSPAGTEVYTQVIQGSTAEINREGLSSGIYFLQVTSNNEIIATEKMVVQ